jgi:NAD(P)-dependent dehydrogenase (short-subunit alcohol dehydrogenase family)
MKTVVITGSTRGIGLALAREFVRQGHNAVVSGRSQSDCDQVVSELTGQVQSNRVIGVACDVRDLAGVQQLWNTAAAKLGSVDIWINNAGQAHGTHRFWDQPTHRIEDVIGTNLLGLMLASHVAINGMLEQGHGAIYNLSGFGRNGMQRDGMAIYGTSKRGVDYFTRALAKELSDTEILMCQMNPGMIVTDMLRAGYETTVQDPEFVRRTYNILGDLPEDAAGFLVKRILANRKNGVLLNRQPRYRVFLRLLKGFFPGGQSREVFKV